MVFQVIRIRAREKILPALVVFLGSLFCAQLAYANPDPAITLEEDLKMLPPNAVENVRGFVVRLSEHEISTAFLEQKLREGLVKKILPEQIIMVLSRMTDNSLWFDSQVTSCAFTKNAEAKNSTLSLINDALLGSLTRDDLLSAIKVVCGIKDGAGRLAQTFEVYSYVTNRLRVNKNIGWPLALVLLERNESKASINQFVLILQEVFKARGNIESALSYTTSRLKSGAALRTTTNELKEQFLR